MKRIILILFGLMGLIMTNVSALTYGNCDYSTVSRLKSLVSNVNLSYDYHIDDGEVYFDITLTNIPNGVYFRDTSTNLTYTYQNTLNGEIIIKNYSVSSGSYKFYSYTYGCDNISLGTKYYRFPVYNIYYNHSLCADIPNYSLCQKWVKSSITYERFKKLVNDYKESLKSKNEEPKKEEQVKSILDIIFGIYINYYYYILIFVIITCSLIIYIKQKKDKFKL